MAHLRPLRIVSRLRIWISKRNNEARIAFDFRASHVQSRCILSVGLIELIAENYWADAIEGYDGALWLEVIEDFVDDVGLFQSGSGEVQL